MDSLKLAQILLHLRDEHDPIKKAHALKELHDTHDIAYSYIAKELEVSPAYVSSYIRLLRLPELVLDGYYTNTISLTHLFILARVKDKEQIVTLYENILTHGMSALELDEAVRNILHGTVSEGEPVHSSAIRAIEQKIKHINPHANVKSCTNTNKNEGFY
ncbi:MAG: Nucleoid occlusion protein [Microgenomates bacterium OLB23]|nr:MAG: Nucleoid occlusion protein [Microgenomates bacterium OLB23]